MMASEAVQKAIEAVVRERFAGVSIDRVEVEEGEDHDGETAFFVRIVFDGKPQDFDVDRLTGITRHIRSRLNKMGEKRFPYTRFLARTEIDGAAA